MTENQFTQEIVPLDWAHVGTVMSNFDGEIEAGMEEKLKSGEFYGDYPAWNFHAQVWYDGENFKCMVKRFHSHVGTITAPTLEEIMEIASGEWSYD